MKKEKKGCKPLEKIDKIDLGVSLYGHLQILILLNNGEKNEYIKGFEDCLNLYNKWKDEL